MSQIPETPHTVPPEPPVHPITPAMVLALRQTRPWVFFLAVMGFVFAGLAVVGGLAVVALMGFAGSIAGMAGEWGAGMGAALGLGFGALYILMGLLYFFPSLYLMRYASGIQAMLRTEPVAGLERALAAQKSFWKFVGIAVISILALNFLFILAVFLVAGAAAFAGMARG